MPSDARPGDRTGGPATDPGAQATPPTTGPGSDPPAPRPTFTHRRERHGLVGPFGARRLALGALVVVAVAVALVALTSPLGSTAGPGPRDPRATAYIIGPAEEGLRPGDRAPEWTVDRADGTTFQLVDVDGRPLRLADLRGKGVWVNFWATWCPPCQAETPVLRDTYEAFRDRGLELVAISVQESSAADVAAYAERYGLGYRIGFDGSGDIFRSYRVFALPTQFFIDPTGVVRAVVQGPLDAAQAAAHVASILPSGVLTVPLAGSPDAPRATTPGSPDS